MKMEYVTLYNGVKMSQLDHGRFHHVQQQAYGRLWKYVTRRYWCGNKITRIAGMICMGIGQGVQSQRIYR